MSLFQIMPLTASVTSLGKPQAVKVSATLAKRVLSPVMAPKAACSEAFDPAAQQIRE
jgi:hypothetical protein